MKSLLNGEQIAVFSFKNVNLEVEMDTNLYAKRKNLNYVFLLNYFF
jgi:hypothetical protein